MMQLVGLVRVGLVAIAHRLDFVAGRKFSKLANSLMIKQKEEEEIYGLMIQDKVSL